MHRRAFAAVEQAELNAGGVDRLAHHAAEGVDLADDLPLGHAADRRVAAHLGDGVAVRREQADARADPRRGHRRLDAGMPRADHEHVVLVDTVSAGQGRDARIVGVRDRQTAKPTDYAMYANHTFLITGGASGLGAGCARRLTGAGANVVIADLNAAAGEALATELG